MEQLNLNSFDYVIKISPTNGSSVKYHGWLTSYDVGTAVGFGGFFDARNPLGSFVTKMFSTLYSIFFYYTAYKIHWNIKASLYDVKKDQVNYFKSINEYKFTSKNNNLGKSLYKDRSLKSINHMCEFDYEQIRKIDNFISAKSYVILDYLLIKLIK